MTDAKDILLKLIEQKLEWGPGGDWLTKDFENLSQRIFDETAVSLSVSTLRRIWGKVAHTHLPSGTTLDALAKFAGFADWRSFQKQQSAGRAEAALFVRPLLHPSPMRHRKMVPLLLIIPALCIGIIAFIKIGKVKPLPAAAYSFSSKPLTRDLPNSVVFTYDAHTAPADSVFIQQSWNPRTRMAVDKNLHTYTSIYYEPGFYQAKLLVGSKVVKEHPLLIPTNGWCGIIANQPVPVYLRPSEFLKETGMELSLATIRKKNIALQPQPPLVRYFNVGNFTPVPISVFSFRAEVKNAYREGAAACGTSYVFLITNNVPIAIPLSAKGCVSELDLFNGREMISGKKADLSRFGVDFSDWVRISCKSTTDKLHYFINDVPVYEAALPTNDMRILGIGFIFQGTGAVRNVDLNTGSRVVFQAFK